MKLLYLYIEDYGCIQKQEFNFDSEIQFHYDWENTHDFSIVSQGLLPNNFWGEGRVKSVSAIVGNNGAGKTTVARFLADFFYEIHTLNKYNFIAIFNSTHESNTCIYNLENDLSLPSIKCIPIDTYIEENSLYNGEDCCPENIGVNYSVDFIYHSNHYSPAHKWGHEHLDKEFDLSTTAYMYKDSNIIL